jgi:hypothetical protein
MDSKELMFQKYDQLIFRLFLVMIGTIPIIINMKNIDYVSPILSRVNLIRTNSAIDTFSYYKFVALIAFSSVVMLIFILKCIRGYKVRQDLFTYSLLGFAFVALLAAYFSDTTYTALIGQFNRFEGAISYLLYVVLAIIALNIRYPKMVHRSIAMAFIPFITVNAILVMCVVWNIKLSDYSWFQQFLSLFMEDQMILTDRSLLMGTLNQWNNTSGFFACLIAFLITCFLIDNQTNYKWMYLSLAGASFIVLVGNISTFGFFCVALFLVVVTFTTVYRKKWKDIIYLFTFGLFTLATTFLMSYSTTPLWDDVLGGRIWEESFGNSGVKLNHIEENREKLEITSENSTRLPKKETVVFEEDPYLSQQQYTLPVLPEAGNSVLSSRIYIWQQTLNILIEKPVFGYGMDTLLFHFPHFNIEARGGISTEDLITDKPHSIYIGILYGTGILGFGLLSLMAVLIVRKVNFGVKQKQLRESLPFIALIAIYSLQGILYDSVVGSTFIIFIVLGLLVNKLNQIARDSN